MSRYLVLERGWLLTQLILALKVRHILAMGAAHRGNCIIVLVSPGGARYFLLPDLLNAEFSMTCPSKTKPATGGTTFIN